MSESPEHTHPEVEDQMVRPNPIIEYTATYFNKKGHRFTITDVRGFQLDDGFYFLFVMVEGMPVPEIQVLNLSSPDVVGLKVTPVRVIEPDAG